MKLLQIFRLRKFIFVNILLFSYVMLNLLDGENYKVMVCDNKVVFRSLDTNTLLTVAVAITDED